jgi:hypothetical protein
MTSALRIVTSMTLSGLGILVAAGCGATGSRPARAQTAALTYAAYPALSRARPSGIAVVSLAQAHSVAASRARPIWVAVAPEDANALLPEISSARELRDEGSRRVWISQMDWPSWSSSQARAMGGLRWSGSSQAKSRRSR